RKAGISQDQSEVVQAPLLTICGPVWEHKDVDLGLVPGRRLKSACGAGEPCWPVRPHEVPQARQTALETHGQQLTVDAHRIEDACLHAGQDIGLVWVQIAGPLRSRTLPSWPFLENAANRLAVVARATGDFADRHPVLIRADNVQSFLTSNIVAPTTQAKVFGAMISRWGISFRCFRGTCSRCYWGS